MIFANKIITMKTTQLTMVKTPLFSGSIELTEEQANRIVNAFIVLMFLIALAYVLGWV